MLVGIKQLYHMGACLFVILFLMGAHTSHAQPCFCSTVPYRWKFILSSNPSSGYVAAGTHHLLSPFLAFSNYLLFLLLGHPHKG